jgi:hypothetical protein
MRTESDGLEPGVVMSPIEEQYTLNEYGVLLGTLQDYTALVIQYGYTVYIYTYSNYIHIYR